MSHPIDLDQDPDQLRLDGLIGWARQELDELESLLPAAVDAQWLASPVPRPRVDTTERASDALSDPAASAALDGKRWALRLQVVRSERHIREAIVAVRGVRLGLARALAAWEGIPTGGRPESSSSGSDDGLPGA